jgi:4-hydroxy-3-methylbut-2-enyl diphosphate reductase
MGQLPDGAITLIETEADARAFQPRSAKQLAYITQTTLSVDDTASIVAILVARFPDMVAPHKEDICYATTNRQEAVKRIAGSIDAMIVIGAPNSSNSQRLREVAERAGCSRALLVQRAPEIDWQRLSGIRRVGITAGASAPEVLVDEVIEAFADRYAINVQMVTAAEEAITFNLPRALRDAAE